MRKMVSFETAILDAALLRRVQPDGVTNGSDGKRSVSWFWGSSCGSKTTPPR